MEKEKEKKEQNDDEDDEQEEEEQERGGGVAAVWGRCGGRVAAVWGADRGLRCRRRSGGSGRPLEGRNGKGGAFRHTQAAGTREGECRCLTGIGGRLRGDVGRAAVPQGINGISTAGNKRHQRGRAGGLCESGRAGGACRAAEAGEGVHGRWGARRRRRSHAAAPVATGIAGGEGFSAGCWMLEDEEDEKNGEEVDEEVVEEEQEEDNERRRAPLSNLCPASGGGGGCGRDDRGGGRARGFPGRRHLSGVRKVKVLSWRRTGSGSAVERPTALRTVGVLAGRFSRGIADRCAGSRVLMWRRSPFRCPFGLLPRDRTKFSMCLPAAGPQRQRARRKAPPGQRRGLGRRRRRRRRRRRASCGRFAANAALSVSDYSRSRQPANTPTRNRPDCNALHPSGSRPVRIAERAIRPS